MSETPDENSQNSQFDPNERNVAEVQAHLDSADVEEQERVWGLEESGKNRSTVMNYEPKEDSGDSGDDAEGNGDGDEVLSEEKKNADGDVVAGPMTVQSPEDQQEAKEEAEEKSASAAGGEDVENYDPYTDPMVPSSSMAEVIAAELASGNGSPTLQGLHDNKPEPKERDDKSTQ